MPLHTPDADAAARRLVVALDKPSVAEAERLAAALAELPVVLKIGHQLVFTGGLALAERLIRAGRPVFLDLKLHDIPRTVEEGTRAVAGLGAAYLTVHAYPQTVAAAVAGRGGSDLKVLGVTVLTSMDDSDARAAGYHESVASLVARRAGEAARAGIDGLVCAAPELAEVRREAGPRVALVVPGIRPAGAAAGDQKRVMTPGAAITAGADLLVVGRPVTEAPDPAEAARLIVADMQAAIVDASGDRTAERV